MQFVHTISVHRRIGGRQIKSARVKFSDAREQGGGGGAIARDHLCQVELEGVIAEVRERVDSDAIVARALVARRSRMDRPTAGTRACPASRPRSAFVPGPR